MSEIRKAWWAKNRDQVKGRVAQMRKGLKKARRIPRAKPKSKPANGIVMTSLADTRGFGPPRRTSRSLAKEELESLARRGAKERLIELEQEIERLRIFLSVE
jgi:hypothetical protein